MVDYVLPTALAVNNSRANVPKIIIANSGGLRFDIYAGPFTKNDQLTASPFNDAFQYIPAVPLGIAKAVLPKLNGEGTSSKRDVSSSADAAGLYGRGEVEELYGRWVAEMHARAGPERRAAKNLTLGYVTQDVRCRILLSGWLPGYAHMYAYRPVLAWETTLCTRQCHFLARRIILVRHRRLVAMTWRSTLSLSTSLGA
jgi:hypothetical protein